jgi:hypothetical protein
MPIQQYKTPGLLLAVCTLFICFSNTYAQNDSPKIPSILISKPEGRYFITAPNGLNLRKKSKADADKMGTISFGDKVDLLTPAKSETIVVDNVKGGMAKVDFDGVIGYAFEGYLSQFPPPRPNSSPEAYVEKIRNNGKEAIYEEYRKDWGGYIQYEEAITIQVADWAEAFLIAKLLFGIPQKLLFPNDTKIGEVIIPNPSPHENAWTDEMKVVRNIDGTLKEIRYSYRGEASGKHISISYPKDENDRGLRISSRQIAD